MTDWFVWPNPLSRGKPQFWDAVSVCCVGVCRVRFSWLFPGGKRGIKKKEESKTCLLEYGVKQSLGLFSLPQSPLSKRFLVLSCFFRVHPLGGLFLACRSRPTLYRAEHHSVAKCTRNLPTPPYLAPNPLCFSLPVSVQITKFWYLIVHTHNLPSLVRLWSSMAGRTHNKIDGPFKKPLPMSKWWKL